MLFFVQVLQERLVPGFVSARYFNTYHFHAKHSAETRAGPTFQQANIPCIVNIPFMCHPKNDSSDTLFGWSTTPKPHGAEGDKLTIFLCHKRAVLFVFIELFTPPPLFPASVRGHAAGTYSPAPWCFFDHLSFLYSSPFVSICQYVAFEKNHHRSPMSAAMLVQVIIRWLATWPVSTFSTSA